MKSKNIEVNDLNERFKQLEIKYNNLREQHITDNLQLRERILQLEENNFKQLYLPGTGVTAPSTIRTVKPKQGWAVHRHAFLLPGPFRFLSFIFG